MKYSWEISVPCGTGYLIVVASAHYSFESVLTILRQDDPIWAINKPRIRAYSGYSFFGRYISIGKIGWISKLPNKAIPILSQEIVFPSTFKETAKVLHENFEKAILNRCPTCGRC
jgi:hypothetical protein